MATGELIAVLAHDEAGACDDATQVKTQAAADGGGDGWQLNGRKSLVYHATAANLILVSAATPGWADRAVRRAGR